MKVKAWREWSFALPWMAVFLGSDPAWAQDARDRLRILAESTPPGVRVVYELLDPLQDQNRLLSVSCNTQGHFFEMQFEQRGDQTTGWLDRPSHFVHRDVDLVSASRPFEPREYVQRAVDEKADTGPTIPIQWASCPWPVVPLYCRALLAAEDLVASESGHDLHASSGRLGLTMVLDRFDRPILISHGEPSRDGGIEYRHAYADESAILPARLTQRLRGAGQTGDRVIDWRVKSITPLDEVPEAIRFDPALLDVARLDPESGDVVHPSHGVLYNRIELERVGRRALPWTTRARPWAITSVGVILLVFGILGYRRIRQA